MPTIATTSRPAYVYDQQTDQWIPVGIGPHSHPNYIENTLIDAKGDLLVGTAPDVVGRQALGTNGQALTVDTATATGVAWTTILPSQTGNTNRFLVTNGSSTSWSNTIISNSASAVGLIVRSSPSQSANIQEWQTDTGAIRARVDSSGSMYIGNAITLFNAGTIDTGFLRVGSGLTGMMFSVVSNSSTQIGAIIRGAASQTANLQEWQNSAGAVLARFTSSGDLNARAFLPLGTTTASLGMTQPATEELAFYTSSTQRLRIASTGEIGVGANPITGSVFYVNSVAAANIGLVVRGATSQTGNLQEWQNSGGTILARVNSAGQFVGDGSQLTGIAAGESISSFMLMGA
jgi:hypothetical protein